MTNTIRGDNIMFRKFILLGILLFSLAACSAASLPEGVAAINPPRTLADFPLINTLNQPMQLSQFKGKYVLLAFGYTHCPDVCPLTLAEFKAIKRTLGDTAANVEFVLVAVDPARDTPERIAEYLSKFDASFVGLTSDADTLTQLISAFEGVFTINDYAGLVDNYTVEHTASKFLLDADGNWIRKYTYGMASKIIAADIQSVLR
jgi:protein SCO1/2